MTKAQDIRELIAEQSNGPGERRAMEATAERLAESLSKDVPFRPEFKAELRRQLVAEARRSLTPWYRRPAVWGSSIGVAAAAAILAVGLQFYRTAPTPGQPQTAQDTSQKNGKSQTGQSIPRSDATVVSIAVSALNLPAVPLPDEVLPQEALPEYPPRDLSGGLKVYRVAARADMAQFHRIAVGLGFAEPQRNDLQVRQGDRSLQMTPDGFVTYVDASPDPANAQPTGGAEGARQTARAFLERASLPVPELQPSVTQGQAPQTFVVTYTPRVEGRPIVNARTVITVTAGSRVARAEAWAQTAYEPEQQAFLAVSMSDALKAAEQKGGGARFTAADLVYVFTPVEQSTYLQPYWRVFGTAEGGKKLARYVPALVR